MNWGALSTSSRVYFKNKPIELMVGVTSIAVNNSCLFSKLERSAVDRNSLWTGDSGVMTAEDQVCRRIEHFTPKPECNERKTLHNFSIKAS